MCQTELKNFAPFSIYLQKNDFFKLQFSRKCELLLSKKIHYMVGKKVNYRRWKFNQNRNSQFWEKRHQSFRENTLTPPSKLSGNRFPLRMESVIKTPLHTVSFTSRYLHSTDVTQLLIMCKKVHCRHAANSNIICWQCKVSAHSFVCDSIPVIMCTLNNKNNNNHYTANNKIYNNQSQQIIF